MSLQVCHCGWSKVTSYQGLRTHQGKKGCTPKGTRIPENGQLRLNHYAPSLTYIEPRIEIPGPFADLLTSAALSGGDSNLWMNILGANRREIRPSENTPANREGIMGCTPDRARPPQSRFNSFTPQLTFPGATIQEITPSVERTTLSSESKDVVNTGPEPRAESRPNDGRTVQGVTTQQQVMGYSPNGSNPLQRNLFGFNSFAPQYPLSGPSFQEAARSRETYTTSSESEDDENTEPEPRAESRPNDGRTVQGLRTQQEGMGYTPNGSRPPQGNIFGSNSSAAPFVFGRPSVQNSAPSRDIFTKPSKSEDVVNTGPEPRAESRPNDGRTVQGVTAQQEVMGYSPNGSNPLQRSIFGFNSFAPQYPLSGPSFQEAARSRETYTTSSESEDDENTEPEPRAESRPNDGRTVQGLRTQQEGMGCTPDEVRPLQGNNLGFNSLTTQFPFLGPSFQKAAPSRETYTTSSESEDDENTKPEPWTESRPNDSRATQGLMTYQQEMIGCTPNGARPPQGNNLGFNSSAFIFGGSSVQSSAASRDIFAKPSKSEDGVSTGPEPWLNDGRTLQGFRTQQEVMGCITNRANPPQGNNLGFNSFAPQYLLSGPSVQEATPSREIITKPSESDGEKMIPENEQEKSRQKIQSTANIPANTSTNTRSPQVSPVSPPKPAAKEVKVETNSQSMFETPPPPTQAPDAAPRVRRALDFHTAAWQPPLEPKASLPSGTQAKPTTKEVKVETNNQSKFPSPRTQVPDATGGVRQTLDFQSGAQQVEQLTLNIPTTVSQETVRSQEMEKERQREEQQAAKAIHDKIRADIQLKILKRQQKMGEVRSSAKVFKGRLDAEWLEINTVFSDVIKAVEAAREEALQPLEKRRQKVDKEEENLIQKLQKEIDALRQTIDELEQNQDVQVSPPTGHDEALKTATVDTLFSFGTLRTTTSNMMQNIQEKLEKLSSVELRRTPKYAVDVRLDPSTAHPYLHISADGKTVCDGGKDQRVPLSSERFDTFGSILGLNRLTSGKSYWEVEVGDKSGWDLGVARGDANRKGKLSLSPDNRFWVIVHFENDKYAALTAPPVNLALTRKPERVGVFVDYEEGLVSFYDVTAKSHIYSFTSCSFEGEIFPYFSPHLRQNEKNSAPLVITALRKQRYIS